MIHMGLCDLESIPAKVAISEYFIIFFDGITKYFYLYSLESKDIDKIDLYKQVENQLIFENKVVRSDIGGEYVFPFPYVCATHGIRHQFIVPYTP